MPTVLQSARRREHGAASSTSGRAWTSCSLLCAPARPGSALRALVAGAILLLPLGIPAPASAQSALDSAAHKLTITRDSLQAILAQIGDSTDSSESGGTGGTRGAVDPAARATAGYIRSRLELGDFRAGDRIQLQVDSEPQLSDTFPVGPNGDLVLPVIGVLSLRGVLRSELQTAMTRELGRFLRDPIVRATPLIRVSIVGEVNKPGFYLLSPYAVVSDVVTAAGGPTQKAKVDKMYVDRAGRRFKEGQALQTLMAEGRTLDDADIRPGDKFVVPSENQGGIFYTVRTISIILSIPLTIFALTQIFKK